MAQEGALLTAALDAAHQIDERVVGQLEGGEERRRLALNHRPAAGARVRGGCGRWAVVGGCMLQCHSRVRFWTQRLAGCPRTRGSPLASALPHARAACLLPEPAASTRGLRPSLWGL